ncbi:22677_t:CDS:2 [Dentiscutata erythropus]|uniref:22677_t:CDS:1 n=1 Tax=Dentiscutata erythropus TaxID=1348616 RepID=A0A9N8VUW4_9GLOM|nr:22677_t:CDS:2 [Dentiscutata erythropus]
MASISNDDIPPTERSTLLHGSRLFFVMFGLGCSVCLGALDQTVVATSSPKIVSDFNALNQISWIAGAYLLTETSLQPIYGKLSNIFGRKVTILFSVFVFELGSLLCGFAQNMISFIIFRAIAGVGGGGILILADTIVTDIVSAKDVGRYQSIINAFYGITTVVGPILGGIFTDHVSWRWSFFINLPLGAITIITVTFSLHSPKQTALLKNIKRLDVTGIAIIIVSTICILLPLNWGGNAYAWNSPIIIAPFCVGVVGYALFGFVESYVAVEPIAPLAFLHGMSFYSFITYVPIYFQAVKGYSATMAGVALAPYVLGFSVATAITGQLYSRTDKVTHRLLCLIGSAFMTISFGLITMWNENSGPGELIGFIIIAGLGAGIIFQDVLLCCQESIEHKDIAITTSLLMFFNTVGGVLGNAIIGNIFYTKLIQFSSSLALPQSFTPQSVYCIQFLPAETRSLVIHAYSMALHSSFIAFIPMCGLSFILSLFMGNIKPSYSEENLGRVI